ncbi:MAG: hypothetical protein R3C28_32585 [Pirellulaceae bacterium]
MNSVLGNDDEVKKGIDNMTDAVSVITEMNRAVAAAILRSDSPLQRFAVREALLEACELCLIFTGAAVEFRADVLAADPILANGSRSSFVYSILNLLVNAHQAQGATDRRPLELELIRCDNELAMRRGLRRPNEIAYFCVTVKDHGKGFSKEARQRHWNSDLPHSLILRARTFSGGRSGAFNARPYFATASRTVGQMGRCCRNHRA